MSQKYPQLFYHPKTEAHYLALAEAICSTNGRTERSVIYLSLSRQTLHYREVSEFFDGRFVAVGDVGAF